MSVSNDLKNEIIEQHYKSSCCRRALLYGSMFAKGRVEQGKVVLSVEKSQYADFLAHLVKEFFNKIPEIYHPKSGGRCLVLSFQSDSAEKYISIYKKEINSEG